MNHRRLLRETQSLANYQTDYFTAKYRTDNNFIWDITIISDRDSVYGSVKHILELTISPNYPFTPPKVRFVSPINNCCIGQNGIIHLDFLDSEWTPAYSIGSIIIAIASYLNDFDMDYMQSRQVERNRIIKKELIQRFWSMPSSN